MVEVDWHAVLAFLKAVDWQVVSSIATAGALLVSAGVFRIQLIDRRRLRADQARTQAEHVAGWLTVDRKEGSWTAHVKNGSPQPIYDVVYTARELNDEDTDAAVPEFIPVVPPDTIWSWEPTFLGPEFFGDTEEMEDIPESAALYTLYGSDGSDRPLYIGSIMNPGGLTNRLAEGRVNHRAYLTFRDGRGRTWQRDTHGRLSLTNRPVDEAPRPARLTGRIHRRR